MQYTRSRAALQGTLGRMSRKAVVIKVINLEEGMPRVEEARLRMQHELHVAREQHYKAVKLVHGYGSSGAGGVLRLELQKELQRLAQNGTIKTIIPGENLPASHGGTWGMLKPFTDVKQD